MGAVLTLVIIVLAQKTLASFGHSHNSKPEVKAEIPIAIEEIEEAGVLS